MKKHFGLYFLVLILFASCSTKEQEAKNDQDYRLVPMSPAMGEVIDLLCPDSLIVGRTEFGDYSTEILKLPVISTYPKLDLEALLRLKPTHVFTSKGMTSPDLIKRIRDFGINVYVAEYTSIDTIFNDFEKIGTIVNCGERGKLIKDSLYYELSKIKVVDPWSCLGVISVDPMYVYGRDTYFSDLIKKLGGVNLIEEENYPIIDKELLLTLNPERIITTNKRQFLDYYAHRSITKSLYVMKNPTRIIEVNVDHLSRPNHNILKVLKEIEDQL